MTRAVMLATLLLLAGCQSQNVAGKQLDLNLFSRTGVGPATIPMTLPHARYTVFSYADPASCITAVQLRDGHGQAVISDAAMRGIPPPGVQPEQMIPTTVQQELRAGKYSLVVQTAGAGCAWMVQGVLNAMLSSGPPPAAASPLPAPPVEKTMDYLSQDGSFRIPVAGIYHLRFDAVSCPFSADVQAADGHIEHIADNSQTAQGSMGSDNPVFLGAGNWKAVVTSGCGWQLTVSPWTGSLGGGSQGFAAR